MRISDWSSDVCSSDLKERCTPLRRDTAKALQNWLKEWRSDDDGPLFPSIRGDPLSRDALEHLVRKHCLTAARSCPSLASKRVTPHTLRHSTAMELLPHGVDQSVLALWLGHEYVETTQIYIHADMRLKEKALARARTRVVQGQSVSCRVVLGGGRVI